MRYRQRVMSFMECADLCKCALTPSDLRLGGFPCFLLELLGERLVVQEQPWIVEFGVPCSLQISHRLKHVV